MSNCILQDCTTNNVTKSNKSKAKEYAERIAEINRQVEGGTVNFEQDRMTINTYKWLASKYDPGTFGNHSGEKPQIDLGAMHLDAIRELSKPEKRKKTN